LIATNFQPLAIFVDNDRGDKMRGRSVELHNPGITLSPANDESSGSDGSDGETASEGLESEALISPNTLQSEPDNHKWRKFFIRSLALICAMALSIGSHL
jgi:hypothetical protein